MNTTMIKEEEVTSESISDLFKSAFLKVSEIDERNQFSVEFEKIDVLVSIDAQNKFIKFLFVNKVYKKTHKEVVARANLANIRSLFVKFYIDTEEDISYLVAEYKMSYEMGIIPFQVVNMAKSFENITANVSYLILDDDEKDYA
jgi:hypothetical protein